MPDLAALGIEIRTGEVVRARRELDGLTAAGGRAERATETLAQSSAGLGRVLGGVTALLGARQLINYADGYQSANARLRQFIATNEQFTAVQRGIIELSERQRVAFTDAADLYSKTAAAASELGASQQDILRFTEGVGAALTLAGTGGTSAGVGALQQLSQAIGGTNIQAQEFNSLIDGARPLLQAVANNLAAAGGSVGKLRTEVIEGRVSSREFFQAAVKGSEELIASAQRIPTTVAQAFTVAESRLAIFVGQQAEASGATRALVGVIDTLSSNLDTLVAAATGYGAARLAKAILETANAGRVRIATLQEEIVAERARLAAAVQSAAATATQARAELTLAEAEAATNASKIAGLRATEAQTVQTRLKVMADLQSAAATVAQADAQLAASKAAGALSYALASARQATETLTATTARQAALRAELTALDARHAAVQGSLAASTAAQTAAQRALTGATAAQVAAQAGLTAAQTAGAGAATLASRALGLLGGPIGAITTVLGLGVTAWLAWGGAAEDGEHKASKAVERSTDDILADLNQQIDKLKQRNALAAGGMPDLAQQGGDAAQRLGQLQSEINRLQSQSFAAGSAQEVARQEMLRVTLTQYGQLAGALSGVADEQAKLDAVSSKQKVSDFLKKYRTDAEKLADALAEAKKELGAAFTPEIEQRIRDSFAKKGGDTGPDLALERQRAAADQEQSIFQARNANLRTFYQSGLIDEQAYYQGRENAQAEYLANLRTQFAQESALLATRLAAAPADKKDDIRKEQIEAQERYNERLRDVSQIGAADAIERIASARERDTAALTRASQAQARNLEEIEAGNTALQREIDSLVYDELALLAIERARIRGVRALKEEELARREAAGVAETQLQVLQAEIDALQKREELLDRKARLTVDENERDAIAATGDAYRSTLGDSIEQGILDGNRRGLDLNDIFLRELKAQFAATILRPVISPVAAAGNQLIGALMNIASAYVGSLFAPSVTAGSDPNGYNGTQNNPSAYVNTDSGRAIGGPTRPFTRYPVNELGTELYSENGRDYLLTGDSPGQVTPVRRMPGQAGGGDRVQVVNNVTVENAPAEAQVTTRPNGSGGSDINIRFLKQLAVEAVADDVRGGGKVDRAMTGRYGANSAATLKR